MWQPSHPFWSCRDVKLHATVLNTRHQHGTHGNQGEELSSNQGEGESVQGTRAGEGAAVQPHHERAPFDGRWLLANYSDLDLGVQNLSEIHLSQRGKYQVDGYYHAMDRLLL